MRYRSDARQAPLEAYQANKALQDRPVGQLTPAELESGKRLVARVLKAREDWERLQEQWQTKK